MHYCESCPDPTLMGPASGVAVCPICGPEEAAPTQPFLVVTGASGSGKSTLLYPLAHELAGEAAVFDIDSLIAPFNMQADGVGVNWAAVRAAWLSVAHGLAAGGLPTVLLGPLAPFHLQDLRQTRWVRSLHFFLLDCPDAIRRERLEARPPWRGRQRERDIEEQTRWSAWLREHIHEGVDTGGAGVDETVKSVAAWVRTVVAAPSRWRDDATLGAARRAAATGEVEAWVYDYLNGSGRNVPMVRGLRRQQRWWIGPVEVPVGELVRIVGPEPDMPYPRAPEDWGPRLAGIQQSLRSGWDAPPVIVDACRADALLVSDGNHRFEAQRQMGRDAVWALLFFDDAEAWRSFAQPWAIDAPRQAGARAAL